MAIPSPRTGGPSPARKIQRLDERITAIEQVVGPIAGVTEVFEKSDFGTPVGGVITLNADWVYDLRASVDLGTDVLEGHNVTIRGNTALQTLLLTASANALISSDADGYINMQFCVIGNALGPAFDLDLGSDTLSIFYLNYTFVTGLGLGGSCGIVRSGDRVTINGCFFEDVSDGFQFDGIIGEVSLTNNSFKSTVGAASFTAVEVLATATLGTCLLETVRFSTTNAADRSVNFNPSATYDTSVRMRGCNLRGIGQLIDAASMQKSDPDFISTGNVGEAGVDFDSLFTGAASFNGNAIETVIAVQGTQYRIGNGNVGHTLFNGGAFTERFTISGAETQLQEITYNGRVTRVFRITLNAELDKGGGGAVTCTLAIQRNNVTIADSEQQTEVTNNATLAFSETVVSLDPGDDIQVVMANETSTANITAISARWTVTRVV